MKDFGTSCFIHGAIVASTVTIIAVILVGTLIYVVWKYEFLCFYIGLDRLWFVIYIAELLIFFSSFLSAIFLITFLG